MRTVQASDEEPWMHKAHVFQKNEIFLDMLNFLEELIVINYCPKEVMVHELTIEGLQQYFVMQN